MNKTIYTTLLFVISMISLTNGKFVIKSIDLTEEQYRQCSTCDQRSERAGNAVMSEKLREFMKIAPEIYTKLAVDNGEVTVKQGFSNERIDTGHSCSKTAEARDIIGTSRMIPNTVTMNKKVFSYNELAKYVIAGADVASEVVLDMNIRVYFGTKLWFGRCRNYARKTCRARARSTGVNEIVIAMAASNIQTTQIGGQNYIEFNMGVKVLGKAKDGSFKGLSYQQQESCNLNVLGIKIGSINGLIQRYSTKYIGAFKNYKELATPKLIAKLEEVLGVKLGEVVRIPVFVKDKSGKTIQNVRGKRSVKSCPKTCPSGWYRSGNTNKCRKFVGFQKIDCRRLHPNAVLEVDNSAGFPFYICVISF